MSDKDASDDDRAMGVIQSPAGQQTIREQNLLWGRNEGTILDPGFFHAPPSKYGLIVNPEDRVPLANDILSARAGRPMDVRTMSDQEVKSLLDDGTAEQPAPMGDNVRVSEEERRRRCMVDSYSVMRNACGPGMQAHHIIPDYALRYGNRGEGEAGEKRIPGLPNFDQGMSICLSGNARMPSGYELRPNDPNREHAWAHTADESIMAGGDANRPRGTLPMNRIIPVSVNAAIEAKPECAKEIRKAVSDQYRGRDLRQLGRTTQTLPTDEAAIVLPRGATQDNWRQFTEGR